MPENTAILLLGSNIQPRENIQKCIRLLEDKVQIVDVSSVWKTKAVGSEGPDFLNAALKINTPLLREELKSKVLSDAENQLGRKRTEDKYAPRTIDVDIIIFNKKILDENFWKCVFIALPASELEPEIRHPKYDISLADIVKKITNSANVELVKDFQLRI